MAKSKVQKQEIIDKVVEKFKTMKSAAFTSMSGFTMAQADDLRKSAKESGVEIFVAKKSLLAIAAKEAGLENVDPNTFEGSILTAVSYDDEVSAAKILKAFTKKNESFVFAAGVLEGKGLTAQEVTQLASLPSKQELLSKMVGSLNAPVTGFVNVLAGNLRGLVTVLDAVAKQKTA
ncbi:MAG: 50S ribosomal protein L10 [Candidatus Uhrbacteria bacterium GW2011_GWD2_41_121]|uniref:Large ribosomal subunit protein uL10 n=1 Tax=Candidatus Uhrbacteria bacterium GW2011_GWC1_41_20 TaxID=1618983 RepID=A0A0G0VAH4_9BACT|nr:MAG: 50S ribosomal protein L10 [Candidatus Uhrbacteria bacterium GW2011_GWE1_39_46]KKR63416.1 MAG: 50S ribosomal protein L10 [Candidatus Uhrbacteria bacterium GW2011_GWC2_40_450]KKR89650.1 MAG: 50S ribosomal protein L10 [Candidatus Uhrbacteria bacterium GW2011_GWD2_41_121]KKR95392.1 MAG: 50S ribosomal protein L10 [Candidatus Uhrbacteria bacterium GW2011_GWD1_41_16]KKR97924.1 MAG: 50S ribosomal protein L10 [Candidatus Uhrbacteria bacterium GW2011_GWC1_41_20]KKS05484.1 MAG: 50S ribosomal prot